MIHSTQSIILPAEEVNLESVQVGVPVLLPMAAARQLQDLAATSQPQIAMQATQAQEACTLESGQS